MRTYPTALIIAALLICSACSGSSPFVPANGPFAGTLTANGTPLGQFTFTHTQGLIGGTATLTIDGNLVPVSITGVLQGRSFNGEMRHHTLGGGEFDGNFNSTTISSGSFSYEDTAKTVLLDGTWVAYAQ